MCADYETCYLCKNHGEFQCSKCDKIICGNDGRLRIVCTTCHPPKQCDYTVHQAHCEDVENIEELVLLFWGDLTQLMFDQIFTVTDYPAIVAECDNKVIGFVSYTPFGDDAVLIVALGILPQYQGYGIGKTLITHVESYAKTHKLTRILVVATNDNLPALAFYQRIGFQLYEVVPNVIAQKLGGLRPGIANIPIRDELRLQKHIS